MWYNDVQQLQIKVNIIVMLHYFHAKYELIGILSRLLA